MVGYGAKDDVDDSESLLVASLNHIAGHFATGIRRSIARRARCALHPFN